MAFKVKYIKYLVIFLYCIGCFISLPIIENVSATGFTNTVTLTTSTTGMSNSPYACKVSSGVYAYVTRGQTGYGYIYTKNVNEQTGVISSGVISSYVFSSDSCGSPRIVKMSNHSYMVVWVDMKLYYGNASVFSILDNGIFFSPITTDTWSLSVHTIDDIYFNSSHNTIIFSYCGVNNYGYVRTMGYDYLTHTIQKSNYDYNSYTLNYPVNSSGYPYIYNWASYTTTFSLSSIGNGLYCFMYGYWYHRYSDYYNATVYVGSINATGYVNLITHFCKGTNGFVNWSNYGSICYVKLMHTYVSLSTDNGIYTFDILNQTKAISYLGYLSVVGSSFAYKQRVFRSNWNIITICVDTGTNPYYGKLYNYTCDSLGALTQSGIYDTLLSGSGEYPFIDQSILVIDSGKYMLTYDGYVSGNPYYTKISTLFGWTQYMPPNGGNQTNATNQTAPPDFSSYAHIGSLDSISGHSQIGDYWTVEEQTSHVNVKIVGLQVLVSSYMIANGIDQTYYYQVALQGTSYFATNLTYYDNDYYLLSFYFVNSPITINDAKIKIELVQTQYITALSTYWDMAVTHTDIFNSGTIEYKKSKYIPTYDGVYNGITVPYTDIVCNIYYIPNTVVNTNPNYPATLNIYRTYGKLLNGSVLAINRNESLAIEYTIPTIVGVYGYYNINVRNRITKTAISQQGFPITLYDYIGEIPLTTTLAKGNYNVTLVYNNANVLNINFDVLENVKQQQIYSIPAITYDNAPYTIYYKFYANVPMGYLALFDNINDNYLNQAKMYFKIFANTSGNITVNHNTLTNHYWKLFITDKYNQSYPSNIIVEHIINKYILPYIFTASNYIVVNKGYKLTYPVNVYGGHLLNGCDIYYQITDFSRIFAGDSNTFNTNITPTKEKTYNASLYLVQNNNTKLSLSYYIFSMTANGTGSTNDLLILTSIPAPISYFVAAFIILVFTLSPLIIGMFVKKGDFNLSSVPQFLYLVMALVGYSLCLIMNLLPIWSIVLLLVMSGLIIVIMYFRSKIT